MTSAPSVYAHIALASGLQLDGLILPINVSNVIKSTGFVDGSITMSSIWVWVLFISYIKLLSFVCSAGARVIPPYFFGNNSFAHTFYGGNTRTVYPLKCNTHG